jgi:SAM-dependent methyltransferase
MTFADRLLTRVSSSPRLWNILRRLVEDGFRGERAAIARELDPWRENEPRTFLDLGCGTGEFAPCFPAARYVGVDLSREYIRFAARAHRGHFAVSDSSLLAMESQRFDAALVLGILHHLPDEVVCATVRELHRVLRPAAIALVMEDIPPPDWRNLPGHLMHWLDRGGYIRGEADYRAFFSPGFEVLRASTMRSGICDYGVYVLRREQVE